MGGGQWEESQPLFVNKVLGGSLISPWSLLRCGATFKDPPLQWGGGWGVDRIPSSLFHPSLAPQAGNANCVAAVFTLLPPSERSHQSAS